VLAFAVDEMVIGGSGDLADRSNVFAAAERRRLEARFAAELTAKPWYDEWRIIGIADGGRELIRVDRSGSGGAILTVPDAELERAGDRDYFRKTIRLPLATFTSRRLNSKRRAGWLTHPVFRPRGSLHRCLHPMVVGLEL
jgi:hypothetical protein